MLLNSDVGQLYVKDKKKKKNIEKYIRIMIITEGAALLDEDAQNL